MPPIKCSENNKFWLVIWNNACVNFIGTEISTNPNQSNIFTQVLSDLWEKPSATQYDAEPIVIQSNKYHEIGLVDIGAYKDNKKLKSNIFFVCVDFRPRNNIKSTGIYKKSKARLDTNLYSAVEGAHGSHPVFPGINSRARKPEIDWLLYAATGYLALEIIHLFSHVLFKENGTNHSDNPSTIITTESPPPTTRHCRRMKKYPAGKISGIRN